MKTNLLALLALTSLFEIASADTGPSFSPQLFHPAPGPDELVTIESARPLHHLAVGAGVYFDYARDPLAILTYSDRTGDPYGATVQAQRHAVGSELWVGLGLFERAQIAVSLPMTLYQVGDAYDATAPRPDGTHVRPPTGYALGDPRLYLKARLYGKGERGLHVALSHWLSVPVGNDGALGGAPHFGGFAGEPRALVEYLGDGWLLALNVGFAWRGATTRWYTAGATQALTYGLGVGADVANKRVRLMAELYGHYDTQIDYTAAAPLELDVSARLRAGAGVSITAGLGYGVVDGVGAPKPRVFAGVSYEPVSGDRDHDGVPDAYDRCPDVAEDRDGFEDEDGCPDPDNDRDTLLDREDRCPNQREDFDNWKDDDGCPDPDNDDDGIPDAVDHCPNDPEDHLPPHPNDGCPASKADSDQDGVSDALDKCPTEPEDVDGWQDEDGCPDPDNDGDGIPDNFDECPNLAEDMNGVDDEDGCPDAGAKRIKVKDGALWIAAPFTFEGNVPGPTSLLDEVASYLAVRTDLKIRIEGYWDKKLGDRAIALSQAQADAVKAYFVAHHVGADRLVAVGYGAVGASQKHVELRLIKDPKKRPDKQDGDAQ